MLPRGLFSLILMTLLRWLDRGTCCTHSSSTTQNKCVGPKGCYGLEMSVPACWTSNFVTDAWSIIFYKSSLHFPSQSPLSMSHDSHKDAGSGNITAKCAYLKEDSDD